MRFVGFKKSCIFAYSSLFREFLCVDRRVLKVIK